MTNLNTSPLQHLFMLGDYECNTRGTTGSFDPLFYNLLFGPRQLRWRTHINVVLCPMNLAVDPVRNREVLGEFSAETQTHCLVSI